jgi:hypothetical protein
VRILLLSIHVLTSIIFIGPVTVATSLFPRYARAALAGGDDRARGVLDLLQRISRTYAVLGISVPAFGVAIGAALGVLLQPWLMVSMALTAVAAGLLALVLIPGQASVIETLDGTAGRTDELTPLLVRLSMFAGIFALTWTVVVVLMIARPGSTTGLTQ